MYHKLKTGPGGITMYRRILVPLDGSKFAECSLGQVEIIAQGHSETEVILLTIHESSMLFTSIPFSESMDIKLSEQRANLDKQILENIETYLAEAAKGLSQKGIKVSTMIEYPDPLKSVPEMIIEYAETSKADLIVMSTHGRSGIKRWALGSVAERVLQISRVPILIVPSPNCRI
jgi:nucleotide-binding universal stress UspA family protein